MKKYLFLNAEDRRPAEESDYRYKKSKPVTAMKAKRDEEGFFIPWASFGRLAKRDFFVSSLVRTRSAGQQTCG